MMSIYKRVENYSNLRGGIIRGDQVAVGDNPNAEQCTFLIKTTVRKKSSQLTNRFRAGYIEFAHLITFAGGGFLDRQDGTVKGTPVYVFNYDDALDVLVRKLTAVKQVKAYTDAMPLDKLAVLVRAVAERLSL